MNEQEIFQAALERDSQQRDDFLDEACGDDSRLRQHVEELLKLHERAGDFFEKPAAEIVATLQSAPVTEKRGTLIGPYRLIEPIGEGGMGVVYMAAQKKPVRRTVALKILKPGIDTEEVVARFEAERQALALMNHPNVAKVLDAGATESGRPYFVMELVRGVPIHEFCDRQKLGSRPRLELFVTVCQAVQHAHQKGIVHRDLKPTNILVELHDVIAVPKVIDFGVAKATNQQLTEHSVYTGFAQMLGTPLYMSPEQAELSGLEIDTRTDIYSLGVLLYELLTGTTPFASETLKQAGYDEMRRIIREDEPLRPSDRITTLAAESLSTISEHRASDPRKLRHTLRGELDWIVMKALEKDRSRRYDSVTDFAADIDRYLSNEPVRACPPSVGYRLRKFVRRNKTVFSTATVAFLFAAILMGAAQIIIRINNKNGRVTELTVPQGNTVNIDGDTVTVKSEPDAYPARIVLDTLSIADVSADGKTLCYLHAKSGALVFRDLESGSEQLFPTEEGHLRIHQLVLSPTGRKVAYSWVDFKDLSWQLRIIGRDGAASCPPKKFRHIHPADWSPDGQYILAVRTKDGSSEIVLVPVGPGDVQVLASIDLWSIPRLHLGRWRKLCFSPDGSQIVYDARARKDATDRDIFLLAADGEHRIPVRLAHPADDYVLGWAPDGRILFGSNRERTWDAWAIRVRDGKAGEPELVRQNVGPIKPMGFTRDGSYYFHSESHRTSVYTATLDGDRHKLLEPTSLLAQHRFEAGAFAPDWSPNGNRLAYAFSASADDHVILIRDEDTGKEGELRPKIGPIMSLNWSPDGTSLLVDSQQGRFVVNVQTEEVMPLASPNELAIWSVDEKAIIYVHEDYVNGDRIMMRSLVTDREVELHHVALPDDVNSLAVSPDGKELAFSTWEKDASASALHIMPVDRSSSPRRRLQLPKGEWIDQRTLVWMPDGNDILFVKRIFSEGESKERTIWRVAAKEDGPPPSSLGLGTNELPDARVVSLWDLRVHPNGRSVAFAAIRVWGAISVMENLLAPLEDTVKVRVEK